MFFFPYIMLVEKMINFFLMTFIFHIYKIRNTQIIEETKLKSMILSDKSRLAFFSITNSSHLPY